MHRVLLVCLVLLLGSITLAQAQPFPDPYRDPDENALTGGLGMTWIDGQPYTTFTLSPDFSIGKFGVGIYLQLLLDNNNEWSLRKDEYEDGPGILRAIRYLRWGRKYDPVYLRVGSLDRAILGNGFLMWNYTNMSNYDKRKIGLVADVDFGRFGFESMWASLGTTDFSGYNIYVRPFRIMETEVPILDRFRIYGTFVRDNKVATAVEDSTTDISAFGIGADLQWLDLPVLKSGIYADFGKYNDYGSGQAYGITGMVPEILGLLAISARFEKRFMNEQFVPSLFGPLYELERRVYAPDQNAGALYRLQSAEKTQGWFGELAGHVINRIRLIGNYQKLNGINNSGVMHLEASAPALVPKFELRAYYDKTGIETFEDARTLDAFSVLTAEVGYQLNSYLLLTTIYRWNWVEDPDNPGTYTTIERVEPRISFRYRF